MERGIGTELYRDKEQIEGDNGGQNREKKGQEFEEELNKELGVRMREGIWETE